MEQDRAGVPDEGSLIVSLDEVVRRQLAPGDEMFTFGRSRDSETHLHVGPPNGRGDCSISRVAGLVCREAGQWTLRNKSNTRPFVVIVGTQRIPLPPAGVQRHGPWVIGPDGVAVELPTPTRTYEIGLHPVVAPRADDPWIPLGSGPSTTPAVRTPTPYERVVLGAKFLSRRQPGLAVGDECAAERASRVLRKVVTARAVENVVGRSRRWLVEEFGLHDVTGRSNVDRVGAYLLAFGVITEDDRLPLPPVDEDPS